MESEKLNFPSKTTVESTAIGRLSFPTLIKKGSYIAGIDGVLNAVIVEGEPIGQNLIQGEGAGPEATTSALVSDICSILRGNIKFPFSISNKERKKLNYSNINEKSFSAYLRFEVVDKPGVLSNITSIVVRLVEARVPVRTL